MRLPYNEQRPEGYGCAPRPGLTRTLIDMLAGRPDATATIAQEAWPAAPWDLAPYHPVVAITRDPRTHTYIVTLYQGPCSDWPPHYP